MVELSPELRAQVDAIKDRRHGGAGVQHLKKTVKPRLLSARRLEVMQLVADGKTNEDIAAELFVSLETVKTHIKLTRALLGARSRGHAAVICLRAGLIQ
jgi:DNA-binding NarL/FixJ family response regulator